MKRVLFSVAVFSFIFVFQAPCGFCACEHLVKNGKHSAMVNIGMSNKYRFFAGIKIRNRSFEYIKHFIGIARISAINEQHPAAAFYNNRIASAGRLNNGYFGIVGYFMVAYTRIKAFTL